VEVGGDEEVRGLEVEVGGSGGKEVEFGCGDGEDVVGSGGDGHDAVGGIRMTTYDPISDRFSQQKDDLLRYMT
jgi:hypothetical protein